MSHSELPSPLTSGFSRVGWLDTVRGIALLAMASYHLTWDFEYFGYLEPGTTGHGLPKVYARLIASTFLLLAGFSLALAHRDGIHWGKFRTRFLKVGGAALLITAATFQFMREGFIHFGILHEIAAASLIGLLFLRLPVLLTFAVAAGVAVLPNVFRPELFNTPLLWWTGLAPQPPVSFDYVPVFPWLAPVLVGIGLGRINAIRTLLRNLSAPAPALKPFALAGRHSLIFYLLHQIPLFGLVWLLSVAAPPDRGPAYLNECQQSCSATSDARLCQRFCSCTLDRLNQGSLLAPLQTGKITADDPQIQSLALQCSREAEKPADTKDH
nr:heparan-alpha-glucosaminide N-acetyltransferase [uncultured Gellertiella sp.]